MTHASEAHTTMPRRRFLAGAATAAATFTVLKPGTVFGAEANSQIELGLIGCGGRGTWITQYFNETGKYRFVACADFFADRAKAAGDSLKLEADRRYTGLLGHRRLLESKLDAVVIESPPYFHPQHATDSVEAGKHVYLAKPIAVDVPGCLAIAEAGKRATQRKLVFLVDFQTRANEHYRHALQLVRNGAIGKLVMAEAHYPWRGGGRDVPPSTPEARLRSWYHVLELSGDFIVEQSIHSLDVATWILDADPIRAIGTGGRKVRPPNSIYDHFVLTYSFPDDVALSFTCIQAIPEVRDEIRARVFGTDGFIDTDYYSDVVVFGKETFKARNPNLYVTGTQVNVREFQESIARGQYDNTTVPASVRSNLTAVLGREAGYAKGEVTWDQMIKQARKLEPDLRGLKT